MSHSNHSSNAPFYEVHVAHRQAASEPPYCSYALRILNALDVACAALDAATPRDNWHPSQRSPADLLVGSVRYRERSHRVLIGIEAPASLAIYWPAPTMAALCHEYPWDLSTPWVTQVVLAFHRWLLSRFRTRDLVSIVSIVCYEEGWPVPQPLCGTIAFHRDIARELGPCQQLDEWYGYIPLR